MPVPSLVLQQQVHDDLLTRGHRPNGAGGGEQQVVRLEEDRARSDPEQSIVRDPDFVTECHHSHLFRRKILNSTTQAISITTRTPGYPKVQFTSGMLVKFMP